MKIEIYQGNAFFDLPVPLRIVGSVTNAATKITTPSSVAFKNFEAHSTAGEKMRFFP